MGILIPETLERTRKAMPEDIREKYTDDELDATAYFLTISGLVPAGTIGVADVDALSIGVTANFIARSLLPSYIEFGAIDPVVIHRFISKIQSGEIKPEDMTTKVG